MSQNLPSEQTQKLISLASFAANTATFFFASAAILPFFIFMGGPSHPGVKAWLKGMKWVAIMYGCVIIVSLPMAACLEIAFPSSSHKVRWWG